MSELKHTGLPVAGYRPQGQLAVDLVNRNKANEERQLRIMDSDQQHTERMGSGDIDGRWLALARTHMEMAYMFWNRAIFRPARVALPEDEATKNEASA